MADRSATRIALEPEVHPDESAEHEQDERHPHQPHECSHDPTEDEEHDQAHDHPADDRGQDAARCSPVHTLRLGSGTMPPRRATRRARIYARDVQSRPLLLLSALAIATAACGTTERAGDSDELPPVAVSSVSAPTTSEALGPHASAAPLGDGDAVDQVVGPADATDAADRVDDPITLAWVGGSNVVWEDRSLPDAVARRVDRIGHRPATFSSATELGPSIDRIIEMIEQSVADGAEGLLLAMNVSWIGWGGTTHCNDVSPVYAFYACILEPLPEPERLDRAAKLQRLVDAVVATEVPAFLYIIAHSTQAMNDPILADRITAAEATIASFDPGLDRISFGHQVITRGVEGADEGTAFFDMVHPSPAGVELLADVLAPDIEAFFAEQLG